MNKRKIAVGPGASSLILIAVVLTLCVLAVLTMISARNDDGLTARSTSTAEEIYTLSDAGEKSLASLDAILVRCRKEAADEKAYLSAVEENLPEGMRLDEDQVFWEETLGQRVLSCGVRVLPLENEKRYEWTLHKLMVGGNSDDEWEDEWD